MISKLKGKSIGGSIKTIDLRNRIRKQSLAIMLVAALIIGMAPIAPVTGWQAYGADQLSGNTVKPILAVTGQGVLGGANYSAANVGNEKSYTIDELKALEELTQLYSAINTSPSKSIYLGKGISIDKLLQESKLHVDRYADTAIDIVAADGYTVKFDPDRTGDSTTKGKPLKTPQFGLNRYYYPNIKDLNVSGSDDSSYTYSNEIAASNGGEIAKSILAWERGGERGHPETIPVATDSLAADEQPLVLFVGQQHVGERNNPLFNKTVNRVVVGSAISETAITIDGKAKTRAEILLMDRADRSYTYSTKGGQKTDYVRGVPLAVLLSKYGQNDTVTFAAADGFAVTASGKTVAELIGKNYILAYEKGTNSSDLAGIYETAKDAPATYGFFTLYGDGESPAKLINSITVTPASGIDFVNSPYKHITNGGISGQDGPYEIDAITGATLTVEGPGVKSSVPLPIREVEGQNAGAHRGVYTDVRGSDTWTMLYEGIKLKYIINDMTAGDNGIHKTNKAYKVLLKNRVRKTIAEFTLTQLDEAEQAGKPVIIAYGTGKEDGSIKAPFVFDGATGYIADLDNNDGPIKLVYDKSVFTADPNPEYKEFGNIAYIYVAEQDNPGYKHTAAPYDTPENSKYVLTVTGDKIGREVNYTVGQLEDLVTYDPATGKPAAGGMGYRSEYSLANSNYWYVNEYEGVQLWKLLQKSGLAESASTGADKDTLISFSATDNYKDFDKFTIAQAADPDQFKYYEKNPDDLNDGKYTGNDAVDLRGTGYPVLVAYGVNSYPYVINNKLNGYLSGLSNDGGPLRIISGKMNYSHANGSKQAKLLDKIIVGEDKFYSTHKYNPNNAIYKTLADEMLNVKVISGSGEGATTLKDVNYKVGDLEEILYGGSLTTAQLKEAKIKGFYEITKGTSFFSDLYEGLDLSYFLQNVVQLPGYKGTIAFSDGTNELAMSLESVLAYKGYNGTTGLGNLAPILAYAKNGSPMVKDKNATGYEGTVKLAEGTGYEQTITVKNDGGPLAVIFPREAMNSASAASKTSLKSITINLTPDNYAHTEAPYSNLAYNTITVSGEGTRLTAAKAFTVADIESRQTLAVTGDYNIKKSEDSQSQTRYRGIPLYNFLSHTDIGLKPNADKVVVTCSDNKSYTFELADVYKSDYINGQDPAVNNLKMILAYGSAAVTNADPEDGKPLVKKSSDQGYDEAYGNSGGPIRLVVGQINADDINSGKILKDVVSIEVTASDMVSWNHSSSPIYQQYLNYPFELKVVNADNAEVFKKTYTLGELEAMSSLVEREDITWVDTQTWEGINLWKFVLAETASVSGIADPTSITAYAEDGFSKELRSIFGMDAMENGIKDGERRVPLIIGYAHSGYPLVPTNTSDGYSIVNNDYGPLRLMTHGNQGACLKNFNKIVVKVGGSGGEPDPGANILDPPFTVKGWGNADITYGIGGSGGIKNLTTGSGGKFEANYHYTTSEGAKTDSAKGIKLIDLLTHAGITGSKVRVAVNTTDGYKDKGGSYENLTLADIAAKEYIVAYDNNSLKIADVDKNGVQASLRIYRNFDDGSTWKNRITNVSGITVSEPFTVYPGSSTAGNLPLAGVRSVWIDKSEGLWAGTYGGGVGYKASNTGTFTVYNKTSTPALETGFVSAVAVDSGGGVWMTQNASYTEPGKNKGLAYMKDGTVKSYRAGDNPETIPDDYVQEIQIDKNGNVWFGSFGGLTKYDPAAETWTTWSQSYKDSKGNSFPALSVDNIAFDGKGGLWLGFYPTGAGTEADPFVGGFAHMDGKGNITPYKFTAEYDSALGSSLLSQVWIRDIAVDSNGGAWIVASGSYGDLENTGGKVWYVDAGKNLHSFTGKELLGNGKLTGNHELRMAAVDPDGGLWLGSSGDGVFYIKDPVSTAPLTVTSQYKGSLGHWPNQADWDNIYSLDFAGSVLYAGSSAGLACQAFSFENKGENSGTGGGGEIPAEYDLAITGAGVEKSKYFTVAQLKNAAGLVKLSKTYSSLNSYGTVGSDTFEGVYLDNLLDDVVGLNSKAKSVTVTGEGNYFRSFNLDSDPLGIYWQDGGGNKIMLAWKKNGKAIDLQLVVGQIDNQHVNKPMWVGGVLAITVNTSAKDPGTGTPGGYEGTKPGQEGQGTPADGSAITQEIKTEVKPQTNVNGQTASSNVSASDVNKALEKLTEGKKQQGEAGAGAKGVVEINAMSGSSDKISRTEVSLPMGSLGAMAGADNVSAAVRTDLGTITLDPEILDQLSALSGSRLSITIEAADPSTLTDEEKAMAGGRPVLDIKVSIDGKDITSFGGRTILAGIPYKAAEAEGEDNLIVVYMDGPDKGKPVKLSLYRGDEEGMRLRTRHLSLYGVAYKEVAFSDIEKHWAGKSIKFLANRNILKGKGADRFDPDGNVTRAEFVTMLANSMDGITVAAAKSAGFDDVTAGAWYADYINWAVAQGIVSGYGDGRFGPNDKITREQMALMTDNFIKAMNMKPDLVKAKADFKDKAEISGWSSAAVTRVQQCGIISGNPDGTFAPKATATRAQAAVIIKGYIESILK
ncbi:hypothetical protein MASR2M70_09400 [Bacillota bacterium]